MRKNQSSSASLKYPELHKYKSPYWVFRKYSSQKKKELIVSTKIEAKEQNAAAAYKKGRELFDAWISSELPTGRVPLFRDVARVVLSSKEGRKYNTYRTAKNIIQNHLMPAFGHLKCDQVTLLKWQSWIADEHRRGQVNKFFNARKHLLEILRRAKDEGLIKIVPKINNPDPETNAGVYLDDDTVQKLLEAATPDTRLLAEIVYRMGARPGEVCQWRYDMIVWEDGENGSIAIPGSITKTGRQRTIPLNPKISHLVRTRMLQSDSPFLFPSPSIPGRSIREYKTGWRAACRRSGLDVELYSLRHTFITNCAKRRVSIVFTARYADTSVAMIDKVYAKATPESLREVAGGQC